MTDFFGVFIIKNKNYITESYAIPQIIDYQKNYPNLKDFENKLDITYSSIENGEIVSKYLWKEDKNLISERSKNIQTLVNRNKFLFNDDKASFVWLRFNDKYFLETLVKTFGYVEDKDLSKFVLDNNLKDNEEFGKVIWNKDCAGKVRFHNEIIDIIKSSPKKEQEKYLESLKNYIEYYIVPNVENGIDIPRVGELEKLSFSQKTEILAKICYYATKISVNEVRFYYTFFPFLKDEQYQKEFKKQNYYYIKDFKQIYNETKNGGVRLPGMPE